MLARKRKRIEELILDNRPVVWFTNGTYLVPDILMCIINQLFGNRIYLIEATWEFARYARVCKAFHCEIFARRSLLFKHWSLISGYFSSMSFGRRYLHFLRWHDPTVIEPKIMKYIESKDHDLRDSILVAGIPGYFINKKTRPFDESIFSASLIVGDYTRAWRQITETNNNAKLAHYIELFIVVVPVTLLVKHNVFDYIATLQIHTKLHERLLSTVVVEDNFLAVEELCKRWKPQFGTMGHAINTALSHGDLHSLAKLLLAGGQPTLRTGNLYKASIYKAIQLAKQRDPQFVFKNKHNIRGIC